MPCRVNTDFVSGFVGLLVFTLFWFNREDWQPQSAVWPETILWALLLLSILLVAKCFLRWQTAEIFAEGSRRRMVIGGGLLILWSVGMQFLGFLVTSALVFPLLFAWMVREERSASEIPLQAVTIRQCVIWMSVIAVEIAVLYFVFSKVLLVPLPRGIAF